MLTRFLIVVYGLIFFTVAHASENMTLSIGHWEFDDIPVENLNVDINLSDKGLGLVASADSLQLAVPFGLMTNLKLRCNKLQLQSKRFSCLSGKVSFKQHDLGEQQLAFNLVSVPENGQYRLHITGLDIASSQLEIDIDIRENDWNISASSDKVSLSELLSFLSTYFTEEQVEVLSEWSVDGDVELAINVDGQSDKLKNIVLNLAASPFNSSDEKAQYVTEDVSASLDFELINKKPIWQWKMGLNIHKGQGYGEPVFIDFSDTPVSFLANGFKHIDGDEIHVESALFEHENIVRVEGSFIGNVDEIKQLNINVEQTDIALLYQHWLQPFLVGTAVDDIALDGQVFLTYQQQEENYHMALGLDEAFVEDKEQRFSVDNISGMIGWSNYQNPMQIDLGWESGYIYAIPIGQSHIKAQAESSSLILLEPWQLPILDGELQINKFSLHRPSGEYSKWTFDGVLTPISMESLSAALKWPLLHGKLSGIIPQVSYENKHVQIEGALLMKLFDGMIVIRDLALDKPFGALPQLYANMDLTELDLDILTQTFDFGKITGKLDGSLTNLRLSNWRPVQFDAHFTTPKRDKSRRRISQKAVDNLSQIGGGASGILSRSFLRFFEDFSYQRLGLSCQLRNEVCDMSGVGETDRGYYIVKGGGLPPRINVVGYTRRVDWPDLIERLKAVSQSSGPVVQ